MPSIKTRLDLCLLCGVASTVKVGNRVRKYCSTGCAVEYRKAPRYFWKYTMVSSNGCIAWIGAVDPGGYGRFRCKLAHRHAWTMKNGPIPDGLFICHSCDNPTCVNPDHLFLGTSADNVADMVKKERGSRGVSHYRSIFSEGEVANIRTLSSSGASIRGLADSFGVPYSTVYDVVQRRNWKHIP